MRIILPERLPIRWMTVFATVMFAVQIVEGTGTLFALLHFVYLVLWAAAFNIAGGFRRATGAYIFWLGLLTIPIGTVTKAVIGERADGNSWTPLLSMGVFVVGMAVVLASAFIVRIVLRGSSSVAEALNAARPLRYRDAAIGCVVLGALLPFSFLFLPIQLYGATLILNIFTSIAVLLATIHVIQASNGRRFFGWLNAIPAIGQTLAGIVGFSKQGMLSSYTAILIALAYMQFRLKLRHVLVLGGFAVFAIYALVPLSQVGRNAPELAGQSDIGRLTVALHLLEDLHNTRQTYLDAGEQAHEGSNDYFTKNVGFAGRLTRWPSDDILISYTSRGNYVGYAGLKYVFINYIPHVIFPDKDKYAPTNATGNYYAREVGLLPPSDTTTGISFGPFVELFHIDGWFALLVVAPVLWVFMFMVFELVVGDMETTPWGLYLALAFSHLAPEGGILLPLTYLFFGNLALVIAMIFSTYFAPAIGAIFSVGGASPASPRPSTFADRRSLIVDHS